MNNVKAGDTIYAIWEAEDGEIKFTLDYNGGKNKSEKEREETTDPGADGLITIVDVGAKREGFKLKGWSKKRDGSGGLYEIDDTMYIEDNNSTIYAIWEAEDGEIKFTLDYNGGANKEGKEKEETTDPGADGFITIVDVGATRNGFELLGWSKEKDGSGHIYENGETMHIEDNECTIYAIWKDKGEGNPKPVEPVNPIEPVEPVEPVEPIIPESGDTSFMDAILKLLGSIIDFIAHNILPKVKPMLETTFKIAEPLVTDILTGIMN